jgi:hypothetical protein
MSAAQVWVELGTGDFVRADLIGAVKAIDECSLTVMIADEREPRVLHLPLPVPLLVERRSTGVSASADSGRCAASLARGLVDAIAYAAGDGTGMVVSLRVDVSGVGWRIVRASARRA